MKFKVVTALSDTVEVARRELADLDESIAREQTSGENANIAVAILLDRRKFYQLGLDELLKAQKILQALASGGPIPEAPTHGDPSKLVIAGQYAPLKLSTAVQAYLSERGWGPLALSVVVRDLKIGGFKINRSKSKYHKGELRDLDTRDLRLLANNNRKRFSYNRDDDTITLRPAQGNDSGRTSARGAKSNATGSVPHSLNRVLREVPDPVPS